MSDDSSRDSAAGRDPEIERTEEAKSSAASLFDGSNAKEKASGLDINVWTGLGMLLLGLGMLAWMALRPVDVRTVQHEMDESDGRAAGTAEA